MSREGESKSAGKEKQQQQQREKEERKTRPGENTAIWVTRRRQRSLKEKGV
jgi:hypothetical protein